MQIIPWKKIGPPKILAESHGRSLVEQRYLDSTGNIREYSQFTGNRFASIILPITTKSEVLAIRQFRPAVNAVTLELPGGSQRHQNQDPKSLAKDELAEETGGYESEVIIRLTEEGCWFEPSSVDIVYYPFLFVGCKKTNSHAQTDDGEYIEVVKISLQKWLRMCETGQVRDSKSLAVTLLAKRFLSRMEV